MADVAGSIPQLILDGSPFDVMADANISEVGSGFEIDFIPTSGRHMKKMTRRVETRESVVLACNGAEREILVALAERVEDFSMSYETAGGDIYRTTGSIEFETRETEELRATIKMFPRTKWQPFVAS